MNRALAAVAIPALLLLAASCATEQAVKDYETFYRLEPYTVVVLPVKNLTSDAEAPRYFLSTITYPLANRGYYVLPVEATADILASEGLGEGGALAEVDPTKFQQYFGADAVLYITLKTWETTYLVFASSVTVAMDYKLVSTKTGEVLWETASEQTVRSGGGGGGGLGSLIAMAIDAAVTAAATDYVPLAAQANQTAIVSLPPGPYHEEYEQAKQDYLKAAREQKARER